MWTEQAAMQWFASHPFTRTLALIAVGAVLSYAKNDWDNFKKAQETSPGLTFGWGKATWMWLEGLLMAVVIAVGPVLVAELLKILGGGTLPQ